MSCLVGLLLWDDSHGSSGCEVKDWLSHGPMVIVHEGELDAGTIYDNAENNNCKLCMSFDVPHSVQLWWDKTLANQSCQSFDEENCDGKITLAS